MKYLLVTLLGTFRKGKRVKKKKKVANKKKKIWLDSLDRLKQLKCEI